MIALALALSVAAPSTPATDGAARVAVLPPIVDEALAKDNRRAVESRAVAGLSGAKGFVTRSDDTEERCGNDVCFAQLAARLGADYLLTVEITSNEGDHRVDAGVRAARNGALVASTTASCEVCSDSEVLELVTSATTRLVPRLEAMHDRPSLVVVSGTPEHALVAIDGADVGAAPIRQEVLSGPHELVVTAEGFVPMERRWDATAGETTTIDFDLDPAERPRRRLGALGWSGVALGIVGVAGVGTGAGLWAIHGRPGGSECGPDTTDDDGRCPREYATRPAGMAAVASGVALLGAGVGLLVADRRRNVQVSASFDHVVVQVRF